MVQSDYLECITNNSYTQGTTPLFPDDISKISVEIKKSATDLSGTYSLKYPNFGTALSRFKQYDKQVIWIKALDDSTKYKVFTGQISAINYEDKSKVMVVEGRGLSGLLTDKKINEVWTNMRVDYIITDETYGFIAEEYTTYLSTWNAFTDHYDQFTTYDDTYWNTPQPAWAAISSGTLVLTGDAGSTRTLISQTDYEYSSITWKLKISAADDELIFGLASDDTLAEAVYFKFKAAGAIDCICTSAASTTTEAVSSPPTVTDYNYYRIEWDNAEARFFINGVLKETITTDVTATNCYPIFQLVTTTSTMTIDYMKHFYLTRKNDSYVSKEKLCSDVVKELCDLGTADNQFNFWVDDDFDLNCQIKKSVSSGYKFGLGSSESGYVNVANITLNEEAKDLYNVVTVYGGEYLTTGHTDTQKGNGSTKAFTLMYKAKSPLTSVTVDSVAKTEGTDFTVTYGKEHSVVAFTTAPADTKAVVFTYDYYIPVVATHSNTASIAYYQNSNFDGKREYIKTDENVKSIARADAYAVALLSYFSDPRTVIKVKTRMYPQLNIGETVMVDAPNNGIYTQEYEIIELSHKMAKGQFETELTLASTTINTSAEIIREILQQIRAIRNKGETSETSLIIETYPLDEDLTLTDSMTKEYTRICDSFVLGHPGDNGKLGRGAILDEFEVDPPAWSITGGAVARSNTQYLVGSYSMRVTPSGTAVVLTDTTSRGDLSTYLTDSTGVVGMWVYLTATTDITAMTLRIGSDSSNYSEISGKVFGESDLTFLVATGWNYVIFRLADGAITGDPAWNSVAYERLSITADAGLPVFYLDYHTCGDGSLIGLNGIGAERSMSEGVTVVTILG